MNRFSAAAVLVVLALAGSCVGQAKVPVTVYYESLCPDSKAFIVEQLTPTARGPLGKFIDLTLVPYGKSSFKTQGSDTEFTCHHGPNECYGNKIHSCAIKNIEAASFQAGKTKQSKTVDFINCIMSRSFPDSTFQTQSCGDENEIRNWKSIAECANSTDGSTLLKENGLMTEALNPKLSSVPTVLFRNHFDYDTQKIATVDFRRALCQQISPSPPECMGSGASTTVLATLSLVGALIASRLF